MAYSFCMSTLKPIPPRTHADVDRFNLRLHEEVAKELRAHPAKIAIARANIIRWKRQLGEGATRDLDTWLTILDRSTLDDILFFLAARTDEAYRLRQSSPFCGIITQARRMEIFGEVYNVPAARLTDYSQAVSVFNETLI